MLKGLRRIFIFSSDLWSRREWYCSIYGFICRSINAIEGDGVAAVIPRQSCGEGDTLRRDSDRSFIRGIHSLRVSIVGRGWEAEGWMRGRRRGLGAVGKPDSSWNVDDIVAWLFYLLSRFSWRRSIFPVHPCSWYAEPPMTYSAGMIISEAMILPSAREAPFQRANERIACS